MNTRAALITLHSRLKIIHFLANGREKRMLTMSEEKVIGLLSKHYTNFILEHNGNKKSYQIPAL